MFSAEDVLMRHANFENEVSLTLEHIHETIFPSHPHTSG